MDSGHANPSLEPEDDTRVAVGRYRTWTDAQEHALVILARNLSSEVDFGDAPDGYVIFADAERAQAIANELSAYDDLHRDAPPARAPIDLPRFGSGAWITLTWVAVLLWAFLRQSLDPSFTEWGASSSTALLGTGEWWRPLSALFLHADIDHLAGNIASGVLFVTLLCRSIGPFTGWAVTLASGVLGNALNAAMRHPEPFLAIGASTAVFGALGALTGFGICAAIVDPGRGRWTSILLPLGGGAAMLGWLGAGGGPDTNTDVVGHAAGFAIGIVLGMMAGWWRLRAQPSEG